jgi:D-alanyl-D-alanine-carboxypeptidase/D-alanyl-D-alanine-endopeptidase
LVRKRKRRIGRVGLGLAAAALGFCLISCPRPPPHPPATPAAGDLAQRRLDAALGGLFAQSGAAGMVIAVVEGDRTTIRGYGRIGPNDARVPDGATLVRLQSLSKLLAAQLLAKLAIEGRVALTDPLQRYAPPGGRTPQGKRSPPITLIDLATHTSGLPRVAAIRADQPLPKAFQARWAWLSRQRRLPAPGTQAVYSNVGFDFLGDALAEAGHGPYGEGLLREITAPLGMKDTTAAPTPEACARLMAGDAARRPWPCFDRSGDAASGGLYSTADDIARWMKHELAPGAAADERRISQAIYVDRSALKRAEGLDHAGPAAGVGLAWILLDATPTHPRLIEKTGGGDGFLTYVVLDPARHVGLFFAINNVSGHRLPPLAASANDLVGGLGAAR